MIFGRRRKTRAGIDISDYSVEFLYLDKAGQILSARVALEPGIVENGEILQIEALAAKIKAGLAKLRSVKNLTIPFREVVISLPESKAFVYCFDLPADTRTREYKNLIQEKAKAFLPVELSKLNWDYITRATPAGVSVVFAGASKALLANYKQVFTLAGLTLRIVDLESLSLGRALLDASPSKTSILIADIGWRTSDLSIFDELGILRLSTSIPFAGQQMTEAIAARLKVSLQEAEDLKRSSGLVVASANQAYQVILDKASQLAKGIGQAIVFSENKNKVKVSEIILAGGGALLPGLPAFLQEQLGRKVGLAAPFIKLGLKSATNLEQLYYANVTGLAILGESPQLPHLNLMNEYHQPLETPEINPVVKIKQATPSRRVKRGNERLVVIFLVLALAGLGAVIYWQFFRSAKGDPTDQSISQSALPEKAADVFADAPIGNSSDRPLEIGQSSKTPTSTIIEIAPIATSSTIKKIEFAEIQKTPTGWLNVRSGPGSNFEISARVLPGEQYEVVGKTNIWYNIKIDALKSGWVNFQYIKIIN